MTDKLLLLLELKRETKVDVFIAIEMVMGSGKITRRSIIINCLRHAGFEAPAAEAASGSGSPQRDHEAQFLGMALPAGQSGGRPELEGLSLCRCQEGHSGGLR